MKTERTLPTGVKIREIKVHGATRREVESNSDYYSELRDSEITEAHINIVAWIVSVVAISLTLYFILT